MNITEILTKAIELEAADIFHVPGIPVTYKIGGHQERMPGQRLLPDDIGEIVDEIYEISRRSRSNLNSGVDDDFSFAVSQLGRFRVNVFRQRGSLAAVLRVIKFGLPDPAQLHIPESVLSLADTKKGLVLVTDVDGNQTPVFVVMKTNTAIQNMIREDKLHQLESAMQAGAAEGICTMDGSLLKLYKEGRITRDTALLACVNYENMSKRLV